METCIFSLPHWIRCVWKIITQIAIKIILLNFSPILKQALSVSEKESLGHLIRFLLLRRFVKLTSLRALRRSQMAPGNKRDIKGSHTLTADNSSRWTWNTTSSNHWWTVASSCDSVSHICLFASISVRYFVSSVVFDGASPHQRDDAEKQRKAEIIMSVHRSDDVRPLLRVTVIVFIVFIKTVWNLA